MAEQEEVNTESEEPKKAPAPDPANKHPDANFVEYGKSQANHRPRRNLRPLNEKEPGRRCCAGRSQKAGDVATFEKIAAKDLQKKAEDKGFRPVAVDIALFGRMVTSEAFLNVEAARQFAHAISTHKIDHEFDYYTAVDDLERSADDDAGGGADMIGDESSTRPVTTSIQSYVNGLVANLTGEAWKREVSDEDRQEAQRTAATAVRVLVEAAGRTPSLPTSPPLWFGLSYEKAIYL